MNEQIMLIAKRVKELREILELTPEYVAKQVGIGVEEYLSYENAQVEIPIGVLYGAASIMGVDPTIFLTGEDPRMDSYTIVRKGNGVRVERYPEYHFTALAYNYIGRDMNPMIVSLIPKKKNPELVTHKGQEFNYVLEGKVCVIFGKHEFLLEAGDSIYFNPLVPHGQKAVDGPAKFLTVINE